MAELHDLSPSEWLPSRSHKRKGRGTGFGERQDRGSRSQGSEVAFGRKRAPALRGRSDAAHPAGSRSGGSRACNRVEYQVVNLRDFAKVDGSDVSPETLKAAGLVQVASSLPVKVLAVGDVSGKLSVSAHKFSAVRTGEDRGRGRLGHVDRLQLLGRVGPATSHGEQPRRKSPSGSGAQGEGSLHASSSCSSIGSVRISPSRGWMSTQLRAAFGSAPEHVLRHLRHVRGWRAFACHDPRARHHAVYLREHHVPASRRGLPDHREAAEGRGGRPEEADAVDAIHHRGAVRRAGVRVLRLPAVDSGCGRRALASPSCSPRSSF